MSFEPRYGQRNSDPGVPCPRHPNQRTISTCKRCNRGTCQDCTIYTEVGTICPECAKGSTRTRFNAPKLFRGHSVTNWILIVTLIVTAVGLIFSPVQRALLYAPVYSQVQPWRLLTVALVHGGVIHVGLNMLTLYIIGPPIERALGAWRFLSLYIISALGGSIAVLAWSAIDVKSVVVGNVGASGALFGLFAAIYVLQKSVGADTRAILILLGVNIAYGFLVSGISWQAHMGGLVIGGLTTWALYAIGKPKPGKTAKQQNTASVLAVIGIFAALIIANYLIYQIAVAPYVVG